MDLERRDCVIIGGGPAGLTAAIYLARFHLSVSVYDDGTSRAASIPISHNHAGFPGGISGVELLARMRDQALIYGADICDTKVTALGGVEGEFVIYSGTETMSARTVLLATGVVNRSPSMPREKHDEALRRGLIRYCPVCDGFEVTDKRVGVIGQDTKAFKEALFLRSYSKDISILSPSSEHELKRSEQAQLQELGISIVCGPFEIDLAEDEIQVRTGLGTHAFDSVYPALGSDVRSELASGVGAMLSQEGCIFVDSHQRTDVPGLYAAGDVVIGLDQISHAMGQAGVAATTIRNDLSSIACLVR
ncbi:NAD(P)/FAD-dependent oxidoreductase [Rhizobium deserti]|uniref:Thioredoxin reductase n=1 Tax=Rhizobium deserti TaxID=2547961 RepID=A0A4R5U6L0_9HYPH|nr:NAD(P)/FAD-dependent oxidoreductase [Rhizobium deserti]TDK29906.1 NAD(P)/FAD-dependent oxidoreductase [Rhizobium deserti]